VISSRAPNLQIYIELRELVRRNFYSFMSSLSVNSEASSLLNMFNFLWIEIAENLIYFYYY